MACEEGKKIWGDRPALAAMDALWRKVRRVGSVDSEHDNGISAAVRSNCSKGPPARQKNALAPGCMFGVGVEDRG